MHTKGLAQALRNDEGLSRKDRARLPIKTRR